MDRFYLEKLVEEINTHSAKELEAALGGHLSTFSALDRNTENGERHLKVLRYLFSVDASCPVARLLAVRERIEQLCGRFTAPDIHCSCHFGYDSPVPLESRELTLILHFYMLANNRDNDTNRVMVNALLDDPDNQILPSWLSLEGLTQEQLADEIHAFCEHFITSDFGNLAQIRNFESAFWRVVNLACAYYDTEEWRDLVAMLPPRFHGQLSDLPEAWTKLRQMERSYTEETFVACSRASLRFCQQLLELEASI